VSENFLLLIVQLALFGLTTGGLGLLCGRYLWPRYVVEEVPTPAGTSADDLEPALSDLEQRLRASESEMLQVRKAVARASDDKGDPRTGR
jgi:hypothetical protein